MYSRADTGRVGTVIGLAAAVLLPTAIGYAVVLAARSKRWLAGRRVPLPEEPLERVGADLCRLHEQLELSEGPTALPGKNLRRTAVRAAYVDALTCACRRLGVAPPAAARGTAVPITEIYRAEAALRRLGLDVRGARRS
ncbi:MAG: hypothetical protein ACR2LF_10165 [Jatrophihabitantaceae bacterium]